MNKNIVSDNFIKKFAICTIVLLFLAAGIVILFDPFFHYHKPLEFLKAVLWEKEYQVPGTLDHFDYDAVIAGSSVAENYNNRWFDERFDCKSVKAIRSYGATADLCYFINRAYESHDLKYVFLNIDPSSLTQEIHTTFEETGSPMYLYDKNPLNDVEYLWNKDVIFERIPYMLATSFMKDYDEGTSYNWAQWKAFNKETILYHYIQKAKTEEMKAENFFDELSAENIKLVTDIVESHPTTQFYIFIPPYSILWWDNMYREGETLCYLEAEKKALLTLLNYDNVRIFNFQNAEDVVYNLDNYTDSLHFSPEINEFMCECLKNGTYELKSKEEVETSIEKVKAYALTAAEYTEREYKDEIKVEVIIDSGV